MNARPSQYERAVSQMIRALYLLRKSTGFVDLFIAILRHIQVPVREGRISQQI
jgi:hypothetical protein